METKPAARFTLGRQSSLAPERTSTDDDGGLVEVEEEDIDPGVRLMYLASEGDVEGMSELLDSGVNANFRDIDDRTALHVAACQGFIQVVQLLLDTGADVDSKDRWGSTPIADAIYYKNHDVIKLLEKHGAKPLMVPTPVKHVRHISEYEIDPSENDFTDSVDIDKGTFRKAKWHGIQVAVKKLEEEVTSDQDKYGIQM
jgi:hypothetical protein